jgi:hypothetical protein
MPRRTRDVSSDASSYPVDLCRAIRLLLPRSGLGLVSGNDKLRWVPRMLVVAAILTAWGAAEAITDRFEASCRVVRAVWPTRRQPGASYGGFFKSLRRATPGLLARLIPVLRGHVRRLARGGVGGAAACREIGRWAVFGVDGSRVECPMTEANERAFGTAGKNKTGPRQFLTVVFHVATGLIYDYRRGDARSSERSHLLQMPDTLPPGALRLIEVPGRGGRRMHLLTDVLDETLLSDEQAEAMYRKRWGVELLYRSLKQTMGRRRMRCRSPANAAAELDRAVIGLWVLGLMSVGRLMEAGRSPCEWSVAASLRAVRRTMRSAVPRPRRGREPSPGEALAGARLDGYRRINSRKSRHWPHKKQEQPPGIPRARNATDSEVMLAARLCPKEKAA